MSSINATLLRLALQQYRILLCSSKSQILLHSRSFGFQSSLLSLSWQARRSGEETLRGKWMHAKPTATVSRVIAQFSMRRIHNEKTEITSERGHTTVEGVCRRWTERLQKESIPEARVSVEYIVAYVLGNKTLHGVDAQCGLSEEQLQEVDTLCERRLQHEPVQYVLGKWDFDDIELKLRPPVFIPRPETEELVGLAAERIERMTNNLHSEAHLLELCCGSGAITLALLHKFPLLQAVAVDVSCEACSLTEENAQRLGLTDRLTVVQGRVGDEAVQKRLKVLSPFNILVSNPPYIPSHQLSTLEPQILMYEDQAALDGGEDGLNVVRDILKLCPYLLNSNSDILMEIQPGQPDEIEQIVSDVKEPHLHFVSSYNDYLERERFCHLRTV
ncbi:MTRF1L release factor glutamine methyltransferase-like isoform X1 [Littorina saxatilis]|uniref:MTRF1L release factor glutamine methyltransferase-like isoform X1 n=1 Tax=Littorina saxatilis TaxID=31220 RepID=UPI0038B51195